MNCMEGIRGFCEPSGGFVWRFCDLSGLWCSDRVRGRKKIIVIYPIRCMRLGNYYKGKVVSNNETKYNILHPLYYTDIYAINYSVYICIVHNISKITNIKIGYTIYITKLTPSISTVYEGLGYTETSVPQCVV